MHINQIYLIGVLMSVCCMCDGQVKDQPLERQYAVGDKKSRFQQMNSGLIEEKKELKEYRGLGMSPLGRVRNKQLFERVTIAVPGELFSEMVDTTIQHFEVLMSGREMEHQFNNERVPGIKGLVTGQIYIGADHRFSDTENFAAFLQRADYELIADQLSLAEINRYAFRKNRGVKDGIPSEKAGGGSGVTFE